jgi:arylsulfatase A-like enzyme
MLSAKTLDYTTEVSEITTSAQLYNVVYLHSHDTGRYIQPYGHAISTPHLQKLAEEGVLFRQAFCEAPTCSPSRAAMLTGQSAHSSGMLGLAHRGFKLNDTKQHIVATLRTAGYHSVLAGIEHVSGGDRSSLGYDTTLPSNDGETNAATWLDTNPTEPFFLDVGFSETHRNAKAGGAFAGSGQQGDSRYCLPPSPLPDTIETRRDMADFKTAAARLDSKIGIVLDALRRNGLMERTLIIYTTDHGIPFPHMKCSLTDHGMGVSLIMRGPEFPGGTVIHAMVSHIDVFPTLCEYVGVTPPDWLQGKSMLPLVQSDAAEINDAIYAEVTYHAAYEPKRAVRTKRWKYIRNFGDRRKPVLANCDLGDSKQLWLDNDWAGQSLAAEELYDLLFDPVERCNLADDARYSSVKQDMATRLKVWMERTCDPLLDGPVPLPLDAKTNDPDDVHPNRPQ